MVKEIIKYPTPPSVEYATDVRVFSENIFQLIEDMKETIEANALEGLAAFQIGSYYNVVVVKNEDGSFLELLNPRLIRAEGKQTTREKTAYFGELSAEVTRYETISIVYQDRYGKDHSLRASGARSVLLQRKLDYTFGATFLQKLSKKEKKRFEAQLEQGANLAISELCPITFLRDKVLKVANLLLLGMLLLLFASFFVETGLFIYQSYIAVCVALLTIFYFFYGQYEGKKYSACTSCQIGNILGSAAIVLVKLGLITMFSYIFMVV